MLIQKKIESFLDFVEIRTKLATLLPFLIALAYVFYTTGTINPFSTLIYLMAALLIDMSVTAINNHFNKREEKVEPHYGSFKSLMIIGFMLFISALLGLTLVYLHGFTILLAGLFCVLIGICYSFGPAPICKSPYGEIASGFTIGVVIIFIVVSINDPTFVPLGLYFYPSTLLLTMNLDLLGLGLFGLITLPAVFCVANIMLANNICDAEGDRSLRYTLVHSIGVKNALRLFAGLYYASFGAIILAVILRQIPIWCLLVLLTFFPIQKNILHFREKQSKAETFSLSVKNNVIMLLAYAFTIAMGGLF